MATILEKIVEYKENTLADLKRKCSLSDLKKKSGDTEPPRNFKAALKGNSFNIIAEIKKASPSLGIIREDFDPLKIAEQYEENGAKCLSVLTEEHFFLGDLSYIKNIKKFVRLPCLRKDFTINEYHVWEARAHEADAILLIAAILDDHQLKDYQDLARELGMACFVEVHDEQELSRVNKINPHLVGVNNRNLKTFEVSLQNSLDLLPKIKTSALKISESGLKSGADLAKLKKAGFNGFLIGESFMKAKNPGLALKKLLEEAQ